MRRTGRRGRRNGRESRSRPLARSAGFLLASGAISALLSLGQGCGYTLGYRAREGLRTIAVPIAENDTLRRELEFPLTEAVVREIQRRTPLSIVDRDEADAVLHLRLIRFDQTVLVEGGDDEVREAGASMHVRVKLTDREGRPLLSRRGERLAEAAEFPVPEDLGLEAAAAAPGASAAASEAFRHLAERIVMLLEAPLGTLDAAGAPRSRRR